MPQIGHPYVRIDSRLIVRACQTSYCGLYIIKVQMLISAMYFKYGIHLINIVYVYNVFDNLAPTDADFS